MSLRTPALLLLAIFNVSWAAAQTAPPPTVSSVKGRALVSKARDEGEARVLKEDEVLAFGHWVKCGRGCRGLQISYCGVYPKNIPGDSDWIRINHFPCRPIRSKRGGGVKGERAIITYPREDEVVRPGTFYLRWDADKPITNFGISLKILLSREIWASDDLDWEAGFYEAGQSLKGALKREQQAGWLNLILIPRELNGRELESVRFSLISPKDERDLDLRLESFEGESDETLRAVARGVTFSEFKLYADAAREFERALTIVRSHKASKASLEWVKKLAIAGNREVSNESRVRQLCSTLKKSAATTDDCHRPR